MDFSCPSCKSADIQQLSVIYENGLPDINTTSKGRASGVSYGCKCSGAGLLTSDGETSGSSQTLASKKAAPPEKLSYLLTTVFLFFFFVIIRIIFETFIEERWPQTLLFIAWTILTVALVYFVFHHNTKTWPSKKEAWDNSFFCNHCGNTFVRTK